MQSPTSSTRAAVGSCCLGESYRFREYAFVRDDEPDAEPTMFAVQCCVCREQSEFSEDPEDGSSWGLDHLETTRKHFTYRLLRTTPVRAAPGAWL
ncbi:hypothetical protein [Streptomyces sp. ODS28]|uniref:DUF7848 domain-containing protein n=1 Tax=Streptomyces sp. ODS28 TaxID=3136688 RepID=UPI0031E6808C